MQLYIPLLPDRYCYTTLWLIALFTKTNDFLGHNEVFQQEEQTDHHFMCPTYAQDGRCDYTDDALIGMDPDYIRYLCAKSCTVQYLLRNLVDNLQCDFRSRAPRDTRCRDEHPNCPLFATGGQCLVSSNVLEACPKSCRVCRSAKTVNYGVTQEVFSFDPLALPALLNVRETAVYITYMYIHV